MAPPLPISMSMTASLEGRLKKGLVDMEFARHLVQARTGCDVKEQSDHAILNKLITSYEYGRDATVEPLKQIEVLKVIAIFYAIFDKNPLVSYKWLKSNRLSTMSVPGVKAYVYEAIELMLEKEKMLGLTSGEAKMIALLADKLKPLEGR